MFIMLNETGTLNPYPGTAYGRIGSLGIWLQVLKICYYEIDTFLPIRLVYYIYREPVTSL